MDVGSVESWLASGTFGAEPSARLSRGEVVGCWRVEAYLGRGLSAEVYRVTNVRFGHEGALKLLVDGSRGHTIKVSAKGNRRLVVWNPGDARPADAVPAPGALGNGDWRRFVCVEPATLWRDQGFTLKPGERHSLSVRISVAKD